MTSVSSINAQDVSVELKTPDSVEAGEDFQIIAVIGKGNNMSFAKLQLEIPEAIKIDSLVNDSAKFMLNGTLAKYIWDRMPLKDTLTVSFRATTDSEFPGIYDIKGHFSFIHNEEKQEVSIPTKSVKVKSIPDASALGDVTTTESENTEMTEEARTNEEAYQTSEEPIVDEEIAAILQEIEAEVIPEPTKKVPDQPVRSETHESIPSTEEPEIVNKKEEITSTASEPKEAPAKPIAKREAISEKPKIKFSVQIVASAVKVDIARLKTQYNLSEEVYAEFHNGLWKYTVGTHSSYGAAKSKLPKYRDEKGVQGAFITAYSNGQRIGVSDAIKQTK